jgi:hypothetical protein
VENAGSPSRPRHRLTTLAREARVGLPLLVLRFGTGCGGLASDGLRPELVPVGSTIITWGSTSLMYRDEPGNLRLLDNVLTDLESGTSERGRRILYTSACDPRVSVDACRRGPLETLRGFFDTVARHGEIDFMRASSVALEDYAAVIFDACTSPAEDDVVMQSYLYEGARVLILADRFCGWDDQLSANRVNQLLGGLGIRFLEEPAGNPPRFYEVPLAARSGLLENVDVLDIFRTVPQELEERFEPVMEAPAGVLMARWRVDGN